MDEREKDETFYEDMRDEDRPDTEPECQGHPVHIALPLTVVRVPVTDSRTMLILGILLGICWTLVVSTVWD